MGKEIGLTIEKKWRRLRRKGEKWEGSLLLLTDSSILVSAIGSGHTVTRLLQNIVQKTGGAGSARPSILQR